MASLSKKLTAMVLAVTAALCLTLGLLFTVHGTSAFAEDDTNIAVLNDAKYFEIDNKVLSGLSSDGITYVGDKNISITIPAGVTSIAASGSATQGILGSLSNKLVSLTVTNEVETIGNYAFYGSSNLTALSLEGATALTTIGESAFNSGSSSGACTALKTITVPANVTSIGKLAFANRTGLETINFYATACADFSATASENPFYRAANTSGQSFVLNIGASGADAVTKIPANMFLNGTTNQHRLKTINFINANITAGNFGKNAFSVSTTLTDVNFANSKIYEIGESAFKGCTSLTTISALTDVTSIGANAFQSCSKLTSITFGQNLGTIGDNAFYGCSQLGNVTLPASVTEIGSAAFNGCTSFTEITVPSGVTEIGTNAFYGCTSAKTINYYATNAKFNSTSTTSPFANGATNVTLNIGNPNVAKITSLPSHLFRSSGTTTVKLSTVNFKNVDINSENFGNNLFTSCTTLKEVTFENTTIEVLDFAAFYGCTSLTSIDLSGVGVEKIGKQAFYGCTLLSQVKLPNTLSAIEEQAFDGCSSIYTVTIPANVTTIGTNAFNGCIRLIEVKTNLSVAAGSTDHGYLAYYALNVCGLNDNGKIQPADANGYVFYVDTNVTYLITYVGTATKLTLPANYNGKSYTIYNKAFMNNTDIVSIDTTGATIIGVNEQAFNGCSSLTSVNLSGVTSGTVGEYLFQDCKALSSVTLPASLTAVSRYMFDGCTSLSKIAIPDKVKTIDANSFQNCTSLSSVTFGTDSELTTIGGSAFANCSSLNVIRVPSSVTTISSSAFAGCAGLRTVYLPEKLTSVGTGIFPVSSGLLLIAADKDGYTEYVSTLSSYRSNLTYLVPINLYYENGTSSGSAQPQETVYRLFDHNYTLVEQADGNWLNNGGMPVQSGYTSSVWYSDADCTAEVDGDWLFGQLSNPEGAINLYAKTINKPTGVAVIPNITYIENKTSYSWTDLIAENSVNTDLFDVTITGYETYYTRDSKDVPTGNMEAGYYTVEITLKEGYGEWAEPYKVPVTVAPMSLDYAQWGVNWVQLIGSNSKAELSPDVEAGAITLYIYSEGNNKVAYTEKQDTEPENTVQVVASYVTWTGKEVTLVLDGDGTYFTPSNYYTVVKNAYGNNSQTNPGVYTTTVTINATNNYIFKNESIKDLGLEIKASGASNTYEISKTWYIVTNKSNALLLGNAEYKISDWTYNQDGAPLAPNLAKGAGNENQLITFSLSRSKDNTRAFDAISGLIASNAKYEDFGYYINNSMPAGNYQLVITVAPYSNGADSVAGLEKQFDFTVKYTSVNAGLIGNLNRYTSIATAMSYAYDGNLHFGDTSSIEILDNEASDFHPTRIGFWNLPANDYMYEAYTIKYDIVAVDVNKDYYPASTGTYRSEQEYKSLNEAGTTSVILPKEIGVYKVYFYVSAPSYSSNVIDVTNSTYRNSYYYLVKIYGVVSRSQLPEIPALDYTRSSVTPAVANANGWFDVHYLDSSLPNHSLAAITINGEDKYIDAGTHVVALTISSGFSKAGLLVWGDDVTTVSDANKTTNYALLTFKINPAKNTAGTLSFVNWTWGTYATDSEANRPIWSTSFDTDYSHFTFTLTSETGEKVYTFGATNGKGFKDADAGNYTLRAYALGNTVNTSNVTGYNWYECYTEIKVTILPATITWDTAPFITSWKYGDDNAINSLTEGILSEAYINLGLDDLMDVYYCLEADISSTDAKKHYTSLSGLMVDGIVPAGNYALVYKLDETVNYEEWVYVVHFSVLKADNYWDITPTVTGWYYGDTNIDYATYKPDYAPHVGNAADVVIEYCVSGVPGWYSSLAEIGLDANGYLPVGTYELKATLAETDNFDSMEFTMTFEVSKAQNSWKDVPGVVSWSEGRWKAETNAFVAADLFGSIVYITIEDANGNVIIDSQKMDEINSNILKSLSVGSYTMTATVKETQDHEGLQSVTYFAVLEDSVGMTGLIAASMVFAVVAIGLAVAGVILLIRRNKKIDEQFRTYIKSELNRR